jgi:hypothetical protein
MAIISGTLNVPTAGTRVQAAHDGNVKTVLFKARQANTGAFYLGGSGVSSTSGMTLAPGESLQLSGLPNGISTSQFWGDAETNANKVDYLGTD